MRAGLDIDQTRITFFTTTKGRYGYGLILLNDSSGFLPLILGILSCVVFGWFSTGVHLPYLFILNFLILRRLVRSPAATSDGSRIGGIVLLLDLTLGPLVPCHRRLLDLYHSPVAFNHWVLVLWRSAWSGCAGTDLTQVESSMIWCDIVHRLSYVRLRLLCAISLISQIQLLSLALFQFLFVYHPRPAFGSTLNRSCEIMGLL